MSAPRFGVTDRPGDIVDRSGKWLAEQLGWRWVKSRREVEVRAGRQVRRLWLQPSKYNRAGIATGVSPSVRVFDEDLNVWRKAHPGSTGLSVPQYPARPHVYVTMLINVDPDLAEVECSGLPQAVSRAAGNAPGGVRRGVPGAGAASAGSVPIPLFGSTLSTA